MSRVHFWKSLVNAPRTTLERLRLLTPTSVWEGTGLGLLAIAAGGAAMLFHGLTAWFERNGLDRLNEAGPLRFAVGSLVCVVAGSFLASWLIARFSPTAGGGGVLPVKLAFWRDFGVLGAREAAVKLVASALTLGSGVSLGPEGPSIQIGAATMSAAAGAAGVAKQSRRAWCAAGAAAGLAAVFNAPLAGITFVLEEVVGDLQSRLLGRMVVAGVVGALVAHAVLGAQPAFQTPPLGLLTWRPWVLVPAVAVLAALGGAWFQKGALAIRGRLQARPAGRMSAYRPVLGALATWAAGITVYLVTGHSGVFGIGYGDVTAAIFGRLGLLAALLLFAGKIFATAGAVGTSGCGGIFAPSLFIGAMAGAGIADLGSFFLALAPGESSMLAMVGMAASLGAVIRAPFTCVLLMFEVTNQWTIVPALLVAVVLSQAIARLVNRHDMYDEILTQNGVDPNQVLPPRHFKRWREIPVSALATFKPVVARATDPASLRALLASARHQYFPVVDAADRVRGVLLRREAELAAAGGGEPRLEPPQWIAAKATVGAARKRLLAGSSDFLCVGDEAEGKVQGVLTLHDLLRGESVLEDDAQS
jgi:chloride channel protein, CIC family